jgi:hypothetical protein
MRQEDPMKTSLVAACLLLTLHSLPCRAAEGAGLPPPIIAISTILQLSEDQVHALGAMIEARETALRPLAEELQRHQQALDQFLRTPDPDPATVGRLVLETRALTAAAARVGGQGAAQFEQVLLPEQLEKLQHIREAAALSEVVAAFRMAGLV